MKKKRKIIFVISTLLVLLGIYLNSTLFLKDKNWKYSRGYYVGDIIQIKEINNFYFCLGNYLVIFSNESINNVGFYSLK